jgi:hypothetical protein
MNLKGIKRITAVVIAVLLLMTSTLAVAADGRGEAEYVGHLELRGFADGLCIHEIQEIRAGVEGRAKHLLYARARLGLSRAQADIEIPDGMVVIAYGFVVRPDGATSEYAAMVDCEESVKGIHEQAREWLHTERMAKSTKLDLQASDTGEAGNPSNPTGAASPTGSARWVLLHRQTVTRNHPPHGQFTNHGSVYRLLNDGSATRNFYAVRQTLFKTPGRVAFGSNWRNDKAIPRQDWGWGVLEQHMIERDPLGTISGPRTIGVSLTAGTRGASATLSWYYTQPDVITKDMSVLWPIVATWEQHFTSAASQTTSGGMEPGSAVETIQPAPGTYRLLAQGATARFRDPRGPLPWDDIFKSFVHTINWHIVY